jgi:hypothetical protein
MIFNLAPSKVIAEISGQLVAGLLNLERMHRMSQNLSHEICIDRDERIARQIPSLTVRKRNKLFVCSLLWRDGRKAPGLAIDYSAETARTLGGPGVPSVTVVQRTIWRFWFAPPGRAWEATACIRAGLVRNSPAASVP